MVGCRKWTAKVVDDARGGMGPDESLREHLATCPVCAGRWRDERVLTRELQILNDRVSDARLPRTGFDAVVREFDRQKRERRSVRTRWTWAAAAAAATLVMVLVVLHPGTTNPASEPDTSLAAASSEDGFVPVPYAPALAQGEFVTVLREELDPAALVRMGLPADGLGEDPVMADVMVGEDGFPRAVRVTKDSDF